MSFLFPASFALPEEPTSPAQVPPTDGNPMLSPAGGCVFHSTTIAHTSGDRKIRRHNPQAAGLTSPMRLRSSTAPE